VAFINVDREAHLAEFAKQRCWSFLCHDLTELPLPWPNASISFINMSQFFEHLHLIDALRLLQDCQRVLKPMGYLRISMPDTQLFMDEYRSVQMDKFASVQPPIYGQVKSQMLKFGLILFGALHKHGEDGHKQCYDEEGLHEALALAWFTEIRRVKYDRLLDAE